MPPTIAIDASRATRVRKTGVEWYAYRLIEALQTEMPGEWQIKLLSDRLPATDYSHTPILPSYWTWCILSWPPRFLWSQVRLAAHLFRMQPSLFFSPVHVLPFFASSPAIVTIHDVDYVLHPEAYGWKSRMYLLLTTWWAVHRATRILTPSEASKRHLIAHFCCRAGKIRVTPLAPMVMERPSPEQIRDTKTRLGIADPYLIVIGRLETKKNTARIVEAFAHIHAQHPALRLVLVGGLGRGHEAVVQAIARADMGDRILRCGWLAGEEMAALLAGAEALVFPSLAEGFGIPILDAFALGVPVITSHTIATEEVAGNAALLVDPTSVQSIADAMHTVVADPTLRSSLIERGTIRVKDFSWQKTARVTVEVFRECVGS